MNSMPGTWAPISVPAGPVGVNLVYDKLLRALDGGEILAPIPQVSRHFPAALVARIESAINPDFAPQPGTVAILTTSGSTGNPRAVEFTVDSLIALNAHINTGAVIDQQFDAAPQWIAALPVTSIGGLNVLTRAADTGMSPIPLASVAGAAAFSIDEVVVAVNQCVHAPAAISLVPTQLRRLLGSEEGTNALKRCALVLIGGSSTPVSDQIRCLDEGISVAFTYGMTETTGGCVFSGKPAPGVEISIDATTSVITIAGTTIASGYRPSQTDLNEPEVSGATFQPFNSHFTTSDVGDIGADGSLHVLGRIDDIVIVNGVNISLGAIKEVLDSEPTITDSFVMPNLTALVVATTPLGEFEERLRTEIAQQLGALAVPSFLAVSELPHLPNGKHDRTQIQNLYG